MRSRLGNLLSREEVRRVVAAATPEIVLHMAAQALVRKAAREPVETVATNVLGTMHLLDALREAPSVRVILVVTTDKVYANTETGAAFRETDAVGGDNLRRIKGGGGNPHPRHGARALRRRRNRCYGSGRQRRRRRRLCRGPAGAGHRARGRARRSAVVAQS